MIGSQADREGFAAFLLRMRAKGIDNRGLFAAIEATPRVDFADGAWPDAIWQDRSLPIACGEVIEGIDLQARILAALDIQPGHRVLEIGTGSGFATAVMARLAGRVLSFDRYKRLCEDARQRFETHGLSNIIVRQADASQGAAADGPFDRIVAWAAFDALPRTFVDQLATGGLMMAPIGPPDAVQTFARLTKLGSRFEREDICTARLQPLQSGVATML